MSQAQSSARGRREVHTGTMDVGQQPAIILPNLDETLVREPEAIASVDTPLQSDYYKELAFMEEPVTIRLEKSSEKNAPMLVDVHVNGRVEWIPVGRPYTVARKYVEVLARSKPIDIQTEHDSPMSGQDPQNRIIRNTRTMHPFSVVRDDNPKGFDWLTRVMMEG